jgi:hypothetical protein
MARREDKVCLQDTVLLDMASQGRHSCDGVPVPVARAWLNLRLPGEAVAYCLLHHPA